MVVAPSGFARSRSPEYRFSVPIQVVSTPQFTSRSGSHTSGRPPANPKVLKPIVSSADVPRENHQTAPRIFPAVFLFNRPQQSPRAIQVDVIRPAVQRRKT